MGNEWMKVGDELIEKVFNDWFDKDGNGSLLDAFRAGREVL